jgi:hypothetical protein
MQQEIFFNTTSESGGTLKEYKDQAQHQNDKVMMLFKSNPSIEFSPVDVWKSVFDNSTPLTSCRRAITTLEKAGLILKTENKKAGIYGRANCTWKLTNQNTK